MRKGVLELYPSIGKSFLPGMTFGGGIDRDIPLLQGKTDQQVAGTEFPLHQDEITGSGMFPQPGENGLQPGPQAGLGRRDVGPASTEFQGGLDNAGDSQLSAGIVLLIQGDGVVEKKKQSMHGYRLSLGNVALVVIGGDNRRKFCCLLMSTATIGFFLSDPVFLCFFTDS